MFVSFKEITCWVLERGTIVAIEAFMALVVMVVVVGTTIIIDESKRKEETEVCTGGEEEEGWGWLMAAGATRVESIGDKKKKFNMFKILISNWK